MLARALENRLDGNTRDTSMVIKEADNAMYQAKQDETKNIAFSQTWT